MITIEVYENGHTCSIPECWDECSAKQLRYIFSRVAELLSGDITMEEFKIAVFIHLSGICVDRRSSFLDRMLTGEQREEKYSNIARLAELATKWMFVKDGKSIRFDYSAIRNPMPKIKCGFRTYHGPESLLEGITFGEYRVAFDYYTRYMETNNYDDLSTLISALYRKSRKKPFSAGKSVECAAKFKKLSPMDRQIICSWFSAADNFIKTADLCVDGRIINFSPLFKQEKRISPLDDDYGAPAPLGITGILIAVADSGTFGTAAQVEATPLIDILLKLYHWHCESRRLKQKYND